MKADDDRPEPNATYLHKNEGSPVEIGARMSVCVCLLMSRMVLNGIRDPDD